MKHLIVGAAASLALALVIAIAVALVMLLLMAPSMFGVVLIVVVFGVVVGFIDWYSERKRGDQ